MECHNIEGSIGTDGTEGNIGSLEFRKTLTNVAQGRWIQSSYNADINLSMETGVRGDQDQVASKIRNFMHVFHFEGKSLSEAFTREEIAKTLYAVEVDRGTQNVHCRASDGKAALYQWIVQFGDDITIMTDHFICLSGANAWEYPKCPQSACLDGDCKVCEDGLWAK